MTGAQAASSIHCIVDLSRIELPDGRVLAFRGEHVVGFNLIEAQRHARRGARTRQEAVTDLYRRDDGLWGIGDPSKELDLVSELAAAVLFSAAALDGLGSNGGGALSGSVVRLRRLRDELVHPHVGPDDMSVFGRLLRGDADTCADDAIAVVKALRPDLLPADLP
jgi:hypothetical protein